MYHVKVNTWLPIMVVIVALLAIQSFACPGACPYKKKGVKSNIEVKINKNLDIQVNRNSKSIILTVKGMDCGDCSLNIQKALHSLTGIQIVRASLIDDYVTITYDETIISPKLMIACIDALGYRAFYPVKNEEGGEV